MPPNTTSIQNKHSLTPKNRYELLLESDDEDETKDETTGLTDAETRRLSELPDEVQTLIFSYLPYRIRLAILTEKYPQKYCIDKLNRLPINMDTYFILHKYI